jgi:hypothetical protein
VSKDIDKIYGELPEGEYHERVFNGEYYTLEGCYLDKDGARKDAKAWLNSGCCAGKYRVIKYKTCYGLYVLH